MDTMTAFVGEESARRAKEKQKVFDWRKAAKYLFDNNVLTANAGLSEDLENTVGEILRDGKPFLNKEARPYLSSNWAIPVLVVKGEEIPMWSFAEETPGYKADTHWPEESLAILKGEKK